MSNALGPVVNNRLVDANKAVPKPHLRERLAQQSSHTTPHGTLTTDAQGRKSFAPNYLVSALEQSEATTHSMAHMAFQPGQRVRVCATVDELLGQAVFPFDPEDAKTLTGCEGVVIADRECAALGLVLVRIYSEPWAFRPAFLQPMPAAEGDDEQDAMTNGPSFDPYSEPLAVGDTVRGRDGCIGRVTLVEPRRLGVSFDCGSNWIGASSWRSSFRLLAKAAPTAATAAWAAAWAATWAS